MTLVGNDSRLHAATLIAPDGGQFSVLAEQNPSFAGLSVELARAEAG